MFTEVDRTWVRHFLGFGATWNQADPRLEQALTATQSVADGGSRPDSTGEQYIRSLVYGQAAIPGQQGATINGTAQAVTYAIPATRGLIQIEAQIASLDNMLGASSVDGDIKVDPGRETIRLRLEGRRLCYSLARYLGMKGPRVNVFGGGQTTEDTDPFWATPSPWWP